MKKLYIVGAGGFGKEVAWLVERINASVPTWALCGFLDDNKDMQGNEVYGYPVLGTVSYLEQESEDFWCVCAVGNPKIRESVIQSLERFPRLHFPTLIDPSAILSENVTIGAGSVICAGVILTVDIRIGQHNIINLNTTIGHDAVTEDFVTICPGANVSGQTTLHRSVLIGTGASIIQDIEISANVLIGAGAAVIHDLKEAGTYVGVPAVKKH